MALSAAFRRIRVGAILAGLGACGLPAPGARAQAAPSPAADAAAAQPAPPPANGHTPATDQLYRLIKIFDFDERKLGNFEDAPMHWRKLEGPGLPFYARGRFDETIGHGAPPSFVLSVETGNVAYEYGHLDLTVLPHADYVLEAHVRGAGLEHARAFVAAYLVDRFEQRIAGSERVSPLVGDTAGQWRRVTLELPGDFSNAYALRVQLWILHAYAWREPARQVDPIVRSDTHGRAWFDDIAIYSLPRARLRCAQPAGLVAPGQTPELIVEVNNATTGPLAGQLRIVDDAGQERMRRPLVVPGLQSAAADAGGRAAGKPRATADELVVDARDWGAVRAIRAQAPGLPPGRYRASLQLLSGRQALLERHVQFAVLPELDVARPLHSEIGVDFGAWPEAPVEPAAEAVRLLGAGAVRVGAPMIGALDTPEKARYFTQIGELVRLLAEERIDACGVMLSEGASGADGGEATLTTLRDLGQWSAMAGPVFAHFGGLLTTWQLGDERIESRADGYWTADQIELVRAQLQRFISYPDLVVPRTAAAPGQNVPFTRSFLVDPLIPTPDVPRMLEFLRAPAARPRWVRLVWDERAGLGPAQRIADRARRLALAKALGPDRVFVPVPLRASAGGGQPAWAPTADYLWLRTLTHYLAGREAVAAMRLKSGTQLILFDGAGGGCLVAWSRCPQADGAVDLYLGDRPVAVTLDGRRAALPVLAGRARVPLADEPILVSSLNTRLMLLQASYALDPLFVQAHASEPKPRLRFGNPYDTTLTGQITLTCPANWQVRPNEWSFTLAPGEQLDQELSFQLPSRQLAGQYPLTVEIRLQNPEQARLQFTETLELGLRDVELSASAYWRGDALVVEQRLRNRSTEPVAFSAFCQPPGWARAENAFREVPAGQSALISYVFADARGLASATLHHGIEEIRGPRRLDQVVQVPP